MEKTLNKNTEISINNSMLWQEAIALLKPAYLKELRKTSDKEKRRIIKLCYILRASLSLTTCKAYHKGDIYNLDCIKQAAWCVGFASSHLEDLGNNQKLFMRKVNYVLKELFGKKQANEYLEELDVIEYKKYLQLGIIAERNYSSYLRTPPIIFEKNLSEVSNSIN
ncbi:hypothetical protein N9T15_00605 [Pelagibacteraceae bacterium]|nr:hypothetical protein [Pelagibacteraceae bacterium]